MVPGTWVDFGFGAPGPWMDLRFPVPWGSCTNFEFGVPGTWKDFGAGLPGVHGTWMNFVLWDP